MFADGQRLPCRFRYRLPICPFVLLVLSFLSAPPSLFPLFSSPRHAPAPKPAFSKAKVQQCKSFLFCPCF